MKKLHHYTPFEEFSILYSEECMNLFKKTGKHDTYIFIIDHKFEKEDKEWERSVLIMTYASFEGRYMWVSCGDLIDESYFRVKAIIPLSALSESICKSLDAKEKINGGSDNG